MNERVYLFHITATWQEQKQTYGRDFLVCAADKDTAEKIAKIMYRCRPSAHRSIRRISPSVYGTWEHRRTGEPISVP